MVGFQTLAVAGRTRVIQLMTLVEEEGNLILRTAHFTLLVEQWDREREPLRYELVELTDQKASFNCLDPLESLPETITYERVDKNHLNIEFQVRETPPVTVRLSRNGGG